MQSGDIRRSVTDHEIRMVALEVGDDLSIDVTRNRI